MKRKNFDRLMRTLRGIRPFQIFTIEVNSGDRYEIDQADALILGPGAAIFIGPGGVLHFFDHSSVTQVVTAPASLVGDPGGRSAGGGPQ